MSQKYSKNQIEVVRRNTDGDVIDQRIFNDVTHGEEFKKKAKEFLKSRETKKEVGWSFIDEESDSSDEVESYNDLKPADLKKECEARGITLTGKEKKPDLVALLEGDDEAKKEEE
jgi:hypothetical protein